MWVCTVMIRFMSAVKSTIVSCKMWRWGHSSAAAVCRSRGRLDSASVTVVAVWFPAARGSSDAAAAPVSGRRRNYAPSWIYRRCVDCSDEHLRSRWGGPGEEAVCSSLHSRLMLLCFPEETPEVPPSRGEFICLWTVLINSEVNRTVAACWSWIRLDRFYTCQQILSVWVLLVEFLF